MIPREHRIRRLVCEIGLESGEKAHVLQQRLGDLCRTAIPEELDRMFSAFAGPERLVQIGRIELDLGRISPGRIGELPGRIGEALREELLKRSLREGGFGKAAMTGSEEPDRMMVLSERAAGWKAFRHFLRTGLLPWWADQPGSDLEETGRELIEENSEEAARILGEEIREKAVRSRIIHQFSDSFLKEVSDLLSSGGSGKVMEMMAWLREDTGGARFSGISFGQMRFSLWEALFRAVAEKGALSEEELAGVLTGAVEDFGPHALLSFLPGLSRIFGRDVRGLQQEREMSEAGRNSGGQSSDPPGEEPAKDRVVQEGDDRTRGLMIPVPDEQATGMREVPEAAEDISVYGLPVSNSGLVLLWPYLPRFFDACHLLKEGSFRDKEAQGHAVALLHYLITNEESAPEQLLPLGKLLCGWELSETLEREAIVTDQEKEEAEGLLTTLIFHWQALKATSPEGLRDAFLRREGLLRRCEGGWLLQVERRGYDMLLGRLPWGISMIRLSWMKETLTVEW